MKTRPDPSTKPYYRCLSCPRFRKLCGGRPTREMDLQNWCEYICDVMDAFHLTSTYVVKEAEVSMKTMEKIRAINCEQDLMRGTARRIEQVVLGPVGEHTCCLDHNDGALTERINIVLAENELLRKQNEFLLKDYERMTKIIDKYLD